MIVCWFCLQPGHHQRTTHSCSGVKPSCLMRPVRGAPHSQCSEIGLNHILLKYRPTSPRTSSPHSSGREYISWLALHNPTRKRCSAGWHPARADSAAVAIKRGSFIVQNTTPGALLRAHASSLPQNFACSGGKERGCTMAGMFQSVKPRASPGNPWPARSPGVTIPAP